MTGNYEKETAGRAVVSRRGAKKARGKGKSGIVSGLSFGKLSRLLVFETTGSLLYGLVAARATDGALNCSPVVVSRETDLERAVAEVLEQLREATGRRLPQKAALVTPSAVGALISLPVNPKTPRPTEQMQELVRWEMEEPLSRQDMVWSLGALLVGRGYISDDERLRLESSGAARGAELYAAAVTRERIGECLALQEQLTNTDGGAATAWLPQAQEDETGPFTWYGVGIGEDIRAQWARAFKKNRLMQVVIYPQLGAALPLISTQNGWIFIDIREEQIGLFQGDGEMLESAEIRYCPGGLPYPEDAGEMIRRLPTTGVRYIYYSVDAAMADAVADALRHAVSGGDITVAPLCRESGDCPQPVFTSLCGAARRMRSGGPGLPPGIAARKPRPPLWKNRELWPWAAIILLILCVAVFDGWMRQQTDKNEWELERLNIEYNRNQQMIADARTMNAESTRLSGELAALEAELRAGAALRDFLDSVLTYRQRFAPDVLEAIARAATEEIVLDKIEENADQSGFYIEGWAMRDTSGMYFGRRLNERLAQWHYKVEDTQLDRGATRFGQSGFTIKVRVIKAAPEISEPKSPEPNAQEPKTPSSEKEAA